MIVSKHAIRRYKLRIGRKNASGNKIRQRIKNMINNHAIRSFKQIDGCWCIETKEFIAKVKNNVVITIIGRDNDDGLSV
jgi:hypothetical protein